MVVKCILLASLIAFMVNYCEASSSEYLIGEMESMSRAQKAADCVYLLIFPSNGKEEIPLEAIYEQSLRPVMGLEGDPEMARHFSRQLSSTTTCCVAVTFGDSKGSLELTSDALKVISRKALVIDQASSNKTQSDTNVDSIQQAGFDVAKLTRPSQDVVKSTHYCPDQTGPSYSNIWRPGLGVLLEKVSCPHPLYNRKLSVSFSGMPPYVVYGKDGDVSGSDVNLIKILSKYFGFDYVLKKEPFWAKKNPESGLWEGTIGSVMYGTSLIGIGVHMTASYQSLVDYAALLHMYDVRLCAVKPRPLPHYLNLIRPFEPLVWLIVIAVFPLSCAAYVFLTKRRNYDFPHEISEMTNQEKVLNLWAAHLKEALSAKAFRHPANSVKIFIGTWLSYAFFVLAAYECNLRAYLVANTYEKPVDSEYDIVAMNKRLFLPRGTHYGDFFKHSPFPIQRQVYEVMEKEDNFYVMENGLIQLETEKQIVADGNVVIWTTTSAKALSPTFEERHGWQPFRLSEKIISLTYNGWVVSKHRRWRDDVTLATLRLTAAGVKQKLVDSYVKPKYLSPVKEVVIPGAFELSHVSASFMVLIFGTVIAAAFFLFERSRKVGYSSDVNHIVTSASHMYA